MVTINQWQKCNNLYQWKKQWQGNGAVRQLMGIDGTATAINHVGSVSSGGFGKLATAKIV